MANRGGWKLVAIGMILAAMVVVQSAVIAWELRREGDLQRRDQAGSLAGPDPAVALIKADSRPIVRPPVVAATEASMHSDEMVVGVEAGGKARAYRLASLENPSGHVVNDLIGDAPVSVVYCNLTRCVRVYADSRARAPLDVDVAGLLNGEMVVRLCGWLYFQGSSKPVEPVKNPPPVAYALLAPVVTTWSDWVRKHPLSDAYLGAPPVERARLRPPIASRPAR